MGYDAEWGVISAADCGAEHERERIWVLAYTNKTQLQGGRLSVRIQQGYTNISNTRWGKDKPGVDRMANGMADRVDRLEAIGNGQVPISAATAFNILKERI